MINLYWKIFEGFRFIVKGDVLSERKSEAFFLKQIICYDFVILEK